MWGNTHISLSLHLPSKRLEWVLFSLFLRWRNQGSEFQGRLWDLKHFPLLHCNYLTHWFQRGKSMVCPAKIHSDNLQVYWAVLWNVYLGNNRPPWNNPLHMVSYRNYWMLFWGNEWIVLLPFFFLKSLIFLSSLRKFSLSGLYWPCWMGFSHLGGKYPALCAANGKDSRP